MHAPQPSTESAARAEALLPLLRRFVQGDYGIALGGAHAKGAADAESDLDLYLFARRVLPNAARAALCQAYAGIDCITSWGETEPFVQAGTDFYLGGYGGGQKVECWLRNADAITATIADCQAGIVRHELVTWTVMGFYNYCALSDLQHMHILEDPSGMLAGWQAAVATYPPKLAAAILARSLAAAQFWPDNFHYRSAVARGDLIYCQGIVQQVVHNLIQVLFALNRVYFPGDKKLGSSLDGLARVPDRLTSRLARLLLPGEVGDAAALDRQRQALISLVQEVAALVQADPAGA